MNPIRIVALRMVIGAVALLHVDWLMAVTINRPGNSTGKVNYSTADPCWVCQQPLLGKVYSWTDKVTDKQERVCEKCAASPNRCYVCSLPVTDYGLDLQDTRFLCERDAKSVMLDLREILNLCKETKDGLESQWSRFLTLPEEVEFSVADRQGISEMAQEPGNDFKCPNVMGFTRVVTDKQENLSFSIAILSGQTRAGTISTCTHELGHAWTRANLSPARLQKLNRDAAEGFCELLAWMRLRLLGETQEIANLRSNLHSHGQADLFIAAEEKFGLNSVLDWMRNGRHDRLDASEPWRVQDLVSANAKPGKVVETQIATPLAAPQPVLLPDRLMLKSVSLGGKRPLAMINQCTLAVGETGKVRLAHTNLTIRCLAIRSDSVTIEVVGTDVRQELRFERKPVPESR
jgi:hypothetical protein